MKKENYNFTFTYICVIFSAIFAGISYFLLAEYERFHLFWSVFISAFISGGFAVQAFDSIKNAKKYSNKIERRSKK